MSKKTEWKVDAIEVSMGLTINLGNYESARIQTGVKLTSSADAPDELKLAEGDYEVALKQGWELLFKEINKKLIHIKQAQVKSKKKSK